MIKNKVSIEYGDVSSCAAPIGTLDKPAYVELLIKPQTASVAVSWGSDEAGLIPQSHEMVTGHVLIIRSYASGCAAMKIDLLKSFMQSATKDLQRIADGNQEAPTGVIKLNADASDAWTTIKASFMILEWSTAADPDAASKARALKKHEEYLKETGEYRPKKGDPDYMSEHAVLMREIDKSVEDQVRREEVADLIYRNYHEMKPKGDKFEDLCLNITKQVFKALSHEFQRPMYRRNGPETRLEPDLFAKIEDYAGRLIDTAVSTKKFRESYILLDILRENPEIMDQASGSETLTLGGGAIEKLMHANVASAVRSRLSTQKIAMLAHKRALKLGY